MIRVESTLGSGVGKWAEVPLSRKEIQKLFQFLDKNLKKSEIMKSALATMNVKKISSVALHFCCDKEMRHLQKQFRKLDRTTDVLSFPTLEIAGIESLYQTLPEEERSWGDLVVSLEAVARGAKRGRRPVRAELLEVLIHGFLHLLGMDHVHKKGVGPKEAAQMKKLQKELFKKFELAN